MRTGHFQPLRFPGAAEKRWFRMTLMGATWLLAATLIWPVDNSQMEDPAVWANTNLQLGAEGAVLPAESVPGNLADSWQNFGLALF